MVPTAPAESGCPDTTPSRKGQGYCSVTRDLHQSQWTMGSLNTSCQLFLADPLFLSPRQMSAGMGTVDSGAVAPGTPQPTRIDVHIHQESSLATLLIRGCSLLRSLTPGSTSQTWGRRRLLVASWVSRGPEGLLGPPCQEKKTLLLLCTLLASLSELEAQPVLSSY